jgi:hypothetical protein
MAKEATMKTTKKAIKSKFNTEWAQLSDDLFRHQSGREIVIVDGGIAYQVNLIIGDEQMKPGGHITCAMGFFSLDKAINFVQTHTNRPTKPILMKSELGRQMIQQMRLQLTK